MHHFTLYLIILVDGEEVFLLICVVKFTCAFFGSISDTPVSWQIKMMLKNKHKNPHKLIMF